MASKMSSNSPSNGGASAHGAIPKDTQAAMTSNDSGQNYEPPDIDPVTLKVSGDTRCQMVESLERWIHSPSRQLWDCILSFSLDRYMNI